MGGYNGIAARNTVNPGIFLIISLILFASASDLEAQSQFITPVYLTDAQLTAGQLAVKQKYQNSPFTKSLQLVQTGDLSQIQQDGVIPLYLPGNSKLYEFQARYVHLTDEGDYIWMGELITRDTCIEETVENECFFGYFRVLKTGERVFGEIQIDTLHYDIRYLGEGLGALVELDVDEYVPLVSDCAMPSDSAGFIPGKTVDDRTEVCPVRVAVLYTQAALDDHPDVLDIINLSIESVNQALRNSDISDDELTIILAGTQLLTTSQFSEGIDLLDDVNSLVSNGIIDSLRAALHADLVVVMTKAAYQRDGVVAAFGDFATSGDSAFAIVEAQSANHPNYTFHHELAHLFGARHQNSANCFLYHDNSGLSYAHGYVFNKGCKCVLWNNRQYYHTIVSACYDQSKRKKIPHYSNPDVEFKGKKTGTTGTNNNAKVLRDAACRVGSYVLSDEPYVQIIGPNRLCPEEERALTGFVSGTPGPYEYRWQVSEDGFNYSAPVITTSNTFWVTAPAAVGEVIFVRLTAGNVTGTMKTVTKAIVADTVGLLCEHPKPINLNEAPLNFTNLVISPNPASDIVTLRWLGDNPGQNNIVIYDSFGREAGVFDRSVNFGETEIRLNVTHLPQGIYWLRLQSRACDKTLRFAIIR